MSDEVDPTLIELPMPIVTERLEIRPYRREDATAMSEAVSSSVDHLRRWLPWADTDGQSVEKSLAVIAEMQAKWARREDLVVGVFDRESEAMLGGSGLHRMDWQVRRFEIGYWLRTSAQGRGIMTECALALADYAFDTLAAQRVEIRVDPRNERSRAIPQRLGFTLEGTLRRWYADGAGEAHDLDVFSMIRADRVPAAPGAG